MPIDKIDSADVLAMLAKIWNETPVTASRVKQRAQKVSITPSPRGYGMITRSLWLTGLSLHRSRTLSIKKAIAYAEAPAAVKAIRETNSKPMIRLALEFLILTAVRAEEVKGATWAEIDLDSRTWAIPAARMKMGRCHRVPLADRAIAILEAAKGLTSGDGLLFPGLKGREINHQAFATCLDKANVPAVPHDSGPPSRIGRLNQVMIGLSRKPPWPTS